MTTRPSLLVEVEFTAGVWTDLTESVNLARTEIVTTRGRASQSDDGQPGTFSCVFENFDGALTPDNPAGTYYPNVVPGKRLRYTVAGVVRFLGRIVSWDPSFTGDGTSDSVVSVTAVDLLGDLATSRMRSGLWYEQRADSPLRQYALDDPSSNVGAADSTGPGGALTRRQSGTGGSCDFAASGQGADDGAVVSFAQGDTSSDFVYLSGSQRSSTVVASVSLRMKPAADGAKRGAMRLYYEGPGFTTPSSTFIKQLTIGVNESSRLFVDYVDTEFSVTTSATATSGLSQDLWTQVVVTLSGTSYYVYVNGTLEVTGSRGISPSMPLGVLQVSTPYTAFGTTMGPWVGGVADVAVYTTVLSGARIAAHALAGSSASTETVGARVARVCGYLGITSSGIGGKTLGAQPFGGRFALDVLQEAVRGDSRTLYADGSTIVYRPDARPWSSSVTLDAEADLDGTPTWSRSGQDRYSIQRANSPTGGLALALDSGAPISGSEGSTIETALYYTDDVRGVAERAVAEARDDRLRVSRVAVDVVTAQNVTASDMVSRVSGDRMRVSGLPGTILGWTYQEGHLLGMTERASISAYVVEMDLGPADAPPEARWDSDSGRWGVDGTSTVGVLTSSGTTVVITSSGTPFTTAAGSYPLDVDINGERVTLNSAPGSSTSPQTFTGVTRGVAPSVARAHSAGESVDVWRSARFTL